VGVDNAWEQRKLEAGKMLENSYSTHTSTARFVGRWLAIEIAFLIIVLNHRAVISFCKKEAIHLEFRSQEGGLKRAKMTSRQSPPTPKTGKININEVKQRLFSMS
jgi:hypothetical protein